MDRGPVMIALCLSLIVVAFALSLPLTWLMRRVAARLGQMDVPGGRKVHDRPIPVTGGVAIFWSSVGLMGLLLAGAWVVPETVWSQIHPGIVEQLAGVRSRSAMGLAVIGALAVLHVLGLIDDRRSLGPIVKLIVQIGVATMVVWLGELRGLAMFGELCGAIIAVLWLVALTNAFNFMDNMDGLCAGTATIGAGVFLASALMGGQWFVAAMLALLIGAMLGFLVFNVPPASIFMGDGGSLVIGFGLAFCALRLTYVQMEPGEVRSSAWWAVFTPVVVLAVPLYDLMSVTVIRLAQGRSLFAADTQHFSHRLVKRGLTRRAAVGVIWALSLATGISGIMLGRVPGWAGALIVTQTFAILLALAILERSSAGRGEPS